MLTVRFTRHTARLQECVRFWRDELGLLEVDRFEGHDGYAGVILALPEGGVQLELTAGGAHAPPEPHPETLIVLYLGSWEAVRERADGVRRARVSAANPYWERNGQTYEDPDGFRVVLAALS